jgi:hypothetical protein
MTKLSLTWKLESKFQIPNSKFQTNSKHQAPKSKQIPSNKLQIPNKYKKSNSKYSKHQIPSIKQIQKLKSKTQLKLFGILFLDFTFCLESGIWNLEFINIVRNIKLPQ